ncbi:ATP-binding cassette domain-containing protein [Flavobacteriaceae bacterium]|nr:ATP-binding cassette domain-containing protein [Flavobacteriaceae bacterium]MDC1056159.1 ATP-binding cassette domain-containing protein [Flavobacteriaceae bacterium]
MKTSSSNAWSRFFKLVKLEKKDILQIFYYAIFAGALSLSLPLGVQAIINLIQGAQISSSWIILVVLVTLGVGFTGTLQIMQLRIIETLQQRIFTRASFELTYRFPKLKLDSLRKYYLPELANRFFDTLSIQKGLAKILIDVPSALIQILFTLILLSLYHPFFILFGLGLVSLMFFVFQYTVRRGLETSLEESKHKYRVAHWIQEIARSIVSFKLSAKSNFGLRKNDELVSDYLNARENHFQVIKLQYIKLIGFKITITAGLLIIGGALVLNQQMNIGQFVAAEIIILLTIASVEKLIVSLETLYDILTSIEKLGGLVDLATEKQGGKELNPNSDFTIELKNIDYVVPQIDKPILSGVNLKINPKDKILIRGISGSGKSSLLNLIAGIINPTQGTVFIGQHNLKALNLNQYRSFLGLSLSEEVLFKGTIKENLTFGDTSITEAIIQDLLNVLGLESFIKNQSMGLESNVNSEGKYISNSVRKKLILARALLHQPKCLILEDPLDIFAIEETKKIIDYLCLEKHPWSIVVVSNNNYWETKCNQIFELKKEV